MKYTINILVVISVLRYTSNTFQKIFVFRLLHFWSMICVTPCGASLAFQKPDNYLWIRSNSNINVTSLSHLISSHFIKRNTKENQSDLNRITAKSNSDF